MSRTVVSDSIDHENTNNTSRLGKTHDLISELHKIDTEVIVPSEGEPFVEYRDPHLRLRRTLTPACSQYKGISSEEAQFMITDTTGERETMKFTFGKHTFQVDGYFWGASEAKATKRIIAIHGVTPGISRTRWHSLGERLVKDDSSIRFCALDWHSLDRTDKPQSEFLTMLPKHYFDSISDALFQELYSEVPEAQFVKMKTLFEFAKTQCPHSGEDGGHVLRQIIEQGCGWGGIEEGKGKSFALCIKSWSGGIGMEMLLQSSRDSDRMFRKNIVGAVIMHPAFMKPNQVKEALEDIPTLMCWAKNDPKVPFESLSPYYVEVGAKIVGPESGGHANFPEFDLDASHFLLNLNY